jgi:hypothetical protein
LIVIRFSIRPAQIAIANGRGNPIFALFDRGVRESNDRDLIGVTPTGVDFDFDLERFNPDYCSRINLRWHNRTGNCFILTEGKSGARRPWSEFVGFSFASQKQSMLPRQ